MHQQGGQRCRSKSVCQHQGVVQPEVTCRLVFAGQDDHAVGKVRISLHQGAQNFPLIAYFKLITAIRHAVNAKIVTSAIELTYFVAPQIPTEILIHGKAEQQISTVFHSKRRERWNQIRSVAFIAERNLTQMAANPESVCFHHSSFPGLSLFCSVSSGASSSAPAGI